MGNSTIIRHNTEIKTIPNGFCFECNTCGYRATYTRSQDGTMMLSVEFIGNGNNTGNIEYNMDPHLQCQVEEILEKHNKKYGEW